MAVVVLAILGGLQLLLTLLIVTMRPLDPRPFNQARSPSERRRAGIAGGMSFYLLTTPVVLSFTIPLWVRGLSGFVVAAVAYSLFRIIVGRRFGLFTATVADAWYRRGVATYRAPDEVRSSES
jgi:hypothetical protein